MKGTTVLAVLLALELALVATEQVLVRSLGQQAIAAALLAAPTGEAALLGLGAVLARIGAHALVPAAIALVLGALLTHHLTGWRWAPRSDPRSPRADHRLSLIHI